MDEIRYRYFVTILCACGCVALAGWALYLWQPSGSEEVASWIQAVGSIAAIGIAVYAARIQTSSAQRQANLALLQAHEGKLRSLIAIMFPAYELFHEAHAHVKSVRSCEAFRQTFEVYRFQELDELLSAVPIHELGSFKSARAILNVRRAIRRIQSCIAVREYLVPGMAESEEYFKLVGESEVCMTIVGAAYDLHNDAVREAEKTRLNYFFRVTEESPASEG